MLIRTLGLVLLIAGIASIITITLPSITGIPFSSSAYLGVNNIVISDSNGVFLVSSICTSVPSSKTYKTYISIHLETRHYPGTASIRIKNPALIRVHLYIVSACTDPGPLPQKVTSFKELDDAIKISLSARMSSGQKVVVYHNLPWKTDVDITSIGGGTRTFIVVYYLPVDSFDVLTSQGQLISGKQALQQALSVRYMYSTSLIGALHSVSIVTKTKLSPRITWLSFARALSIIAVGFLVIAVDAGFHPEYYRGKWRVFRRLAETLGLARSK